MAEDLSPKPPAPTSSTQASLNQAPSTQDGDEGLFFNTATLSRFMRVCYGVDAVNEVQRRIDAYTRIGKFEIAEIWRRVLAHLHGVEVKEDTRRVVKVAKTMKVKS